MKRYVCVLFAVLLMLSLAACGENETATTTTADVTTTTAATTTTVSTTATEIDETTTTEVTTTSKPIDKTTVTKAPTTVATTSSKVLTTTKAPTTTAPKPTVYDSDVFIPSGDPQYHFQDDGSLDLNMLAVRGVYGCDVSKYKVSQEEFRTNYAIPEADVLAAMRKTFVVSDELFAKVKAKGNYSMFGPETLKYENGQFLLTELDGWGGGDVYSNHAVAFADNGKGTLTVYHEFAVLNWDTNKFDHLHYYAVTYTYSGTETLTVYGPTDSHADGFVRCGNKSVLDSLRVKSITKVSSVNGYTAVKTEK